MTENTKNVSGTAPPAGYPKAGARVQKWSAGKTVALALAISMAISAAALFAFGVYGAYFYDKIYRGVSVQGLDLSGKSTDEARFAVERSYAALPEVRDFTLNVGDRQYLIEISQSDLGYDAAHTAQLAHSYGRDGSLFKRLGDILRAGRGGVDLAPAYAIDEGAFDLKAEQIARDVEQESITSSYSFDGKKLVFDRGEAGFTVDEKLLADFLKAKAKSGNLYDASFEPEIREPDQFDLLLIKSAIEKEMRNPVLDLESDPTGNTIIPAQTGISFDLARAKAALDASAERYVELPFTVVEPEYTTEQYRALLFRDVLGEGTTSFNASLAGRTTNVLLANGFVNDTVLAPGEVFSYNETVGPRTYERGFKDAIVYVGTSAEDGVGGGICQVSSTIYYAVLRADLEIVERRNHSRMVVYVPRGEDATVAWGVTDFRFKNNTDFPIRIVATNTKDTITIQLVGTQTVANKQVKMDTTILEHTPFQTIYIQDTTLPPGTQKTTQTGYTGWRSETYRVVYIDGVEVSRTFENKSSYTKYDEIIRHNHPPGTTLPDGTVVPGAVPTLPAETTAPETTAPVSTLPDTVGPPLTTAPPTTAPATTAPPTAAPATVPDSTAPATVPSTEAGATESESTDPPINFNE